MKNISILGSTGSIGTQTLDVIERDKNFRLFGITGNKNVKLLEEQIRKHKPLKAAIADKALFNSLKISVSDTNTEILCGKEGINEIAGNEDNDIVLSAIVGIAGLEPTICAINAKTTVALANKETLVTAGEYVINSAKKNNVKILPVDSEHSAVFQSLIGNTRKEQIKRIILTASGGPFFGKKTDELLNVTVEDALKHPNWSMGRKITIDSATMMNKGLEIIEAKWLFDQEAENIDVIVHPQSVIHSLVEYTDGALIAQLGVPDMRTPISFALNYPDREIINKGSVFDFVKYNNLTFELPDYDTFKPLKLAKKALKIGGTMTAYLNGANEKAVELFLDKKIKFLDIGNLLEKSMELHKTVYSYNIEDVFNADAEARENVLKLMEVK